MEADRQSGANHLEDVVRALVTGRVLLPSFPDRERKTSGTGDGEGSS